MRHVGDGELIPHEPDELPDRPRVVDEASEILSGYGWQLAAGAAGVTAAWGAAAFFGAPLPLLWLVLALSLLLLLYLAPVTREPRLARDVLRRWDQQRIERALDSAGASGDPRMEVAESMAERVVRHPNVDQRARDAATALVRRLRRLLSDLRRVEYLSQARVAMDREQGARSISDLQDMLDARVAEILGQLAALHRVVVLREAASLERVVTDVEELVYALEAEQEVERLLQDAERD